MASVKHSATQKSPNPRSLSLSELQAVSATPAGLAWIASNGRYELPRHLLYLNRKLVDVATRRIKRLLVFMPPRHAKSTTVSHYFPAWYLGTHPDERVILCSYEADFAASWGRKARDVLTEWGPALYGVQVSEVSSAANRWDIADHTGGMNTAGVGGPITGKGAHILIIDDPIKNEQEAQSEVYRQHMWDWYLSTAYSRLEPDGAVIVTLTRWHEDDLAGRLLKEAANGGEAWEVVCFPALAEAEDELGRVPGDALWPERFNEAALQEKRRTLESALWWAALYQQHPTPASGDVFQRAWFSQRYKDVPPELHIVQSIDSAFKEGVTSDYSVIGTWGYNGLRYYKLAQWRARVAFPELLAAIKDQAAIWNPEAILLEDKGSGQSALQVLRRETNLPLIGIEPIGSKRFRADSASPAFQSGLVELPEYAEWVADYIEEMVGFPRRSHDDQVDETSQFLNWVKRQSGGIPFAATRPAGGPLPALVIAPQHTEMPPQPQLTQEDIAREAQQHLNQFLRQFLSGR